MSKSRDGKLPTQEVKEVFDFEFDGADVPVRLLCGGVEEVELKNIVGDPNASFVIMPEKEFVN